MALNLEGVISMMWYWGGGVQWWGWLIMSLTMVAFWGLVIWAIWYVTSRLTHDSHATPQLHAAQEILDQRLARGEIDTDEYQRLRDLLHHDRAPSDNGS